MLGPDQLALVSLTFRKRALAPGAHPAKVRSTKVSQRARRRVAVGERSRASAPKTARWRRPCASRSPTPRPSGPRGRPRRRSCASARPARRRPSPPAGRRRRGRTREDGLGNSAALVALPHVPRRGASVLTSPVAVVVGFLVVGMVIGIAAFFVSREATRIAQQPPPALYHLDDALAWVVERPRTRSPPRSPSTTSAASRVPGRVLQAQRRVVQRVDRVPGGPGRDRRVGDGRLRARALCGDRRGLPPRTGVRRHRHAIELLARHRGSRSPRRSGPGRSPDTRLPPHADRLPW